MGRIEEIHYLGLLQEFGQIGYKINIDYSYLKDKWADYKGSVVTEAVNGKIVGFATTDEPMIYVDSDYQRQGIGSKLLKKANISCVWVANANVPANKFYERNGFKPTESREVVKLGCKLRENKWVKSEAT